MYWKLLLMVLVISLSSVALVNAEDKSSFNIFEFIKGLFSSGDKEMITSDNDDLEQDNSREMTYYLTSTVTKQISVNNPLGIDSLNYVRLDSVHYVSAFNETQARQQVYEMFNRWLIHENSYADIYTSYQYTINSVNLMEVINNTHDASIQS